MKTAFVVCAVLLVVPTTAADTLSASEMLMAKDLSRCDANFCVLGELRGRGTGPLCIDANLNDDTILNVNVKLGCNCFINIGSCDAVQQDLKKGCCECVAQQIQLYQNLKKKDPEFFLKLETAPN